jgi:diguanylate cyclase (GGDEF)-like protein
VESSTESIATLAQKLNLQDANGLGVFRQQIVAQVIMRLLQGVSEDDPNFTLLLRNAEQVAGDNFDLIVELEALRRTDPLTEMWRIDVLNDLGDPIADNWYDEGKSVACIFIDGVGIRRINNRYGHTVGNRCLKNTARVIRKVMDAFIKDKSLHYECRYGGDEFSIIACNLTADTCQQIITEIDKEVRSIAVARNRTLQGIHGGFAISGPKEFLSIEELHRLADCEIVKSKLKRKGKLKVWLKALLEFLASRL